MIWFILFDLVLLLGLLIAFRQKQTKPEASTEYWVFLRSTKLPHQASLMRDLIKRRVISQQEAMLFNDVRLNVIHVLQSKNPALFQPQNFEEAEPVADPIWLECASAHALAMVKFTHAKPDTDTRYLHVLPHLAYSLAQKADGIAIFDVEQRKLMRVEELAQKLENPSICDDCDFHVRVQWQDVPFCEAHTWGLSKIGIKELTTGPIDYDIRTLAGNLLLQSAARIWDKKSLPEWIELYEYGSEYRLVPDKKGKKLFEGRVRMRIFQVDQR